MSDVETPASASENINRIIGRVKFFNSRRGFGFVEGDVFDPKDEQKDYFFHFRDVQPTSNNYKVYLQTNEYVEFEVGETDNADPKKRLVAKAITGLNGGPLLMDAPISRVPASKEAVSRRYDQDSNTKKDSQQKSEMNELFEKWLGRGFLLHT